MWQKPSVLWQGKLTSVTTLHIIIPLLVSSRYYSSPFCIYIELLSWTPVNSVRRAAHLQLLRRESRTLPPDINYPHVLIPPKGALLIILDFHRWDGSNVSVKAQMTVLRLLQKHKMSIFFPRSVVEMSNIQNSRSGCEYMSSSCWTLTESQVGCTPDDSLSLSKRSYINVWSQSVANLDIQLWGAIKYVSQYLTIISLLEGGPKSIAN